MDLNFNKTDDSEENLSKISSKSIKCKSFSDIRNMNNDVSFSMILDKNSPYYNNHNYNQKITQTHSTSITKPIAINNNNVNNDFVNNFELDLDSSESDFESDFDEKVERMMTAETPPDPFITIQTRSRLRWVDDGNAYRCGLCKEKFRLFLRLHHCIVEGTPVTLANGMARKIEDIYPKQILPSWNSEHQNVNNNDKHVNALLDQGSEPCMKVVLEDNREIIATSDHQILSILPNESVPKYVMMKDLTNNHRLICSTLEGVLDDPSLDQYDYIIPGTTFSIKRDRDKCLSFARLCGYSLTDGSVEDNNVISEDFNLVNLDKTKYHAEYIFDCGCPRSIRREFVAAWLSTKEIIFDPYNKCVKIHTLNYHPTIDLIAE